MLVKQSEKSSLFNIFLRNIFYIENIHLSVKGYPYWYVLTLWLSPIFTWVPIWKKWYDAKKNISKSAEHLRPQGKKHEEKSNIQTWNLEICSQNSEERTFRAQYKHDSNDSEKEKQVFGSKGLTAAGGFWVITQPRCCLLCPPSEENFHWFAQSNYTAAAALIERDVISKRPNKSIW